MGFRSLCFGVVVNYRVQWPLKATRLALSTAIVHKTRNRKVEDIFLWRVWNMSILKVAFTAPVRAHCTEGRGQIGSRDSNVGWHRNAQNLTRSGMITNLATANCHLPSVTGRPGTGKHVVLFLRRSQSLCSRLYLRLFLCLFLDQTPGTKQQHCSGWVVR